MGILIFKLSIVINPLPGKILTFNSISGDVTVAELIRQLLRQLEMPPTEHGWALTFNDYYLPMDALLANCVSTTDDNITMVLLSAPINVPITVESKSDKDIGVFGNLSFANEIDLVDDDASIKLQSISITKTTKVGKGEVVDIDGLSVASHDDTGDIDDANHDDFVLEYELYLDNAGLDQSNDNGTGSEIVPVDESADDSHESINDTAYYQMNISKNAEQCATNHDEFIKSQFGGNRSLGIKNCLFRRANVRYYTRMNPERVHPLLVIISRDMIEKVLKKGTDQRSTAPFQVDNSHPIEIEPILPGCDCYPPKIETRLGTKDFTAIFRVVPRVLGVVDGAKVMIHQNHSLLAEVYLDVKVVQRSGVIFSGIMTFLLPCLSAILKYFGLNFEEKNDQEFNLYLRSFHLVFDQLSPLTLTGGLGLLTSLLWWFARPRIRDVFWDVEKVAPLEQLQRIASTFDSDPDKGFIELRELVTAFPDFQKASLYLAGWLYKVQDYSSSLEVYQRVFKLGVVESSQYLKASLAASRGGNKGLALEILQLAEEVLPQGKLAPVIYFNMGCYHAELGNHQKAMNYLWQAFGSGYTNAESYLKDPDLDPLRSRRDFQRLVAGELTVPFRCGQCNKSLWAKLKHAGMDTQCRKCGSNLIIPSVN